MKPWRSIHLFSLACIAMVAGMRGSRLLFTGGRRSLLKRWGNELCCGPVSGRVFRLDVPRPAGGHGWIVPFHSPLTQMIRSTTTRVLLALAMISSSAFASQPVMEVEHNWCVSFGKYEFGLRQFAPITMPANEVMPEETVILPRILGLYFGTWSANLGNHDVGPMAGWLSAVIVAAVIVFLIRSRRGDAAGGAKGHRVDP